jgi:hypothetical protein
MPSLVNTIAGIKIYREDNALLYVAGFAVDADGDDMAYAPAGSDLQPLDLLGNAGSPGNWWGITTDPEGNPYIQQSYHRAPGYYVSCTSLANPAFPSSNPDRFMDASQVPFFVLPSGFGQDAKIGDLGLGYNTRTGDNDAMIYADIGPKNKLGEGSVALAKSLKLNPDPRAGGTESRIICYWFVPGSSKGWQPVDTWWHQALSLFRKWGGLKRLKEVLTQMS